MISRRASDRLRAGHLWVYASDVEQLIPQTDGAAILPGELVSVLDSRSIPLGTALFSDTSQIALRKISPEPAVTRAAYLDEVRARVATALDLRDQLAPTNDENNACRLIFSEADNLPGIIADRYNDLILLQLLTQGTAQEDLRQVLADVLRERLHPATIVERPDPRIRELENLPAPPTEALYSKVSDAPELSTIFTINNLRFHYDATAGQKTGAFLDQRLNYAAAARHAHGSALDVCTYQGGFALHLAKTCQHVTGVDSSRAALEVADRNLELNPGAAVDWIEADAFLLLRDYDAAGEKFDTIVLDPPAFTKSKRSTEGALRGYKELNLRALRMLRPGGRLITCSCSHHVSLEDFTGVVASAASDAHRTVQILETRGAAPDHPSILTLPETNYLKCLILHVA